jgi:hypothetical protein
VPSSAPAKSFLFIYFCLGVEFGVRLVGRVGLTRVDGILGAVRGAGKIFFLFGMLFFFYERIHTLSVCVLDRSVLE